MLLCFQQFVCYMDIKEMDNRTKAKRRDHSSDSNQTSCEIRHQCADHIVGHTAPEVRYLRKLLIHDK